MKEIRTIVLVSRFSAVVGGRSRIFSAQDPVAHNLNNVFNVEALPAIYFKFTVRPIEYLGGPDVSVWENYTKIVFGEVGADLNQSYPKNKVFKFKITLGHARQDGDKIGVMDSLIVICGV